MKKKFRIVSVLLTVVLLMSAFATPVAAGQGDGRGERQSTRQIQYLDAEVRVIDGQAVIVIEIEGDYVNVPFVLPGKLLVDGQPMNLAMQVNAVVIATESGSVAVPFEDFDVVVAGGQIKLVAEENPFIVIPVVAFAVSGGGLAFLACKAVGVGKLLTWAITGTSAIAGAFTGYVTGRAAGW